MYANTKDELNKMLTVWQAHELALTSINRAEYENFGRRRSHAAFKKGKNNLAIAIDSIKNFLIEYQIENEKRLELEESGE